VKPAAAVALAGRVRWAAMKTIDEMLSLQLLTSQQHREVAAWVARSKTPEAILEMPAHLWRAVERASVVMNIDADLTRPPALGW
jgi:hypothetical protein